jgi:hypothetical protein
MKLRAFHSISVAIAGILLTGCVGYVPTFSKVPVGGKPISKSDADFIVPGRTTRAEVIQKLGKQHCRESLLIPAMGYGWEMPAGYGFWFIFSTMTAASDVWEMTRWRALFLAFDSRDVVTRKEFVKLKTDRTLDHQLEKWAGYRFSKTPPQ